MKNQNVVYRFQITALVPEIFKFEKCAKYANEMTCDVIHSTQYYLRYIKIVILANYIATQFIETWHANSSIGNTPVAIKILFPW